MIYYYDNIWEEIGKNRREWKLRRKERKYSENVDFLVMMTS